MPSIGSEVIGRVAEEFLLCGTPVIVSGVGSLNEVLFDEKAGDSYSGLDSRAAANLIRCWLRQAVTETTEMRADRAFRARQLFSLETMGEALEVQFKSL